MASVERLGFIVYRRIDTIKRDSPSHEIGGLSMTRRRRYAPCLVFRMTACSPSLPEGGILA
ncbi:MAG: hypothetical protein ACI30S_09385 [Muribaculaceae bacterium]